MANVMSLKKLKNHTSRNGFDLSKRNIFSAKVGELLPVYCKEVIPGDKFKINVKSFTRTMPVNTAAYTRIKEYYDWFFVPTNLLWNKFNTFVTQMSDNNQHADGINSNSTLTDTHPYFTHKQVKVVYTGFDYIANNKNMFGFERKALMAKLMDYLGYGDITRSDSLYATNPSLNPFPLLAYQKIYSDYYRDSQWEKANAASFNIDYIKGNTDLNIPIGSLDINAGLTMFDLRYANWNKDLFTGVKPNAQFGDAASVIINSEIASITNGYKINEDHITAEYYDSSNAQNLRVSSSGVLYNYVNANNTDANSFYKMSANDIQRLANVLGLDPTTGRTNFSILALRQAEALQKWKEITQSQQQDYKSQIEAHFGVSLSDAYSERCHYIDGFSDVIDINEVVNTNINNGSTENLADIAGKGVGVNDGYTSFSSDVHGYLMCIYHAVPLLDYSLETRISRQNLKTMVTDYAIPELDKTGMVSVPFIEMSNDIEMYDDSIELIGYAPRYYDYKTDIDEVHGSARNKNSAWVAPFNDQYLKNLLLRGNALGSIHPIDYTFFKINPAILDPIFAQQLDGAWVNNVDSSVESDQLLTNCSFDVKCVRNLDYDGLPY